MKTLHCISPSDITLHPFTEEYFPTNSVFAHHASFKGCQPWYLRVIGTWGIGLVPGYPSEPSVHVEEIKDGRVRVFVEDTRSLYGLVKPGYLII
jgi:hypothetical protein